MNAWDFCDCLCSQHLFHSPTYLQGTAWCSDKQENDGMRDFGL